MQKLHLVLLIHSHQPVGNFDHVLEEAYAKCYLPFLQVLEKHPAIRLGLHYSGSLLEWTDAHHPEFFDLLRTLVSRGQVEMVGGGFYEPILIAIPFEDRIEQVKRLADYLENRIGTRPTGAWLAERVWEPQLPSTLAAAGVDYTLLDDSHFLWAGFEPEQLFGHYQSEDLGAKVSLIPGVQKLRYLIPFQSPEENIAYLRQVMMAHPGGMAAMGDDCEKFGVWPGTHKWCYEEGWLEKFFAAVEANSDWLVTTPPAEYLAAHPPLGHAALATASYAEMGEWSLPPEPQRRYHAVQAEFAGRPDVLRFLRGGFWRNFFVKYAESNLLHKKMLYVASKLRAMETGTRRGLPFRRALADARTHLLRAQCNDAYWHGIFGGLYSPHLRTALWQELIRAEKIADTAAAGHASYSEMVRQDLDADGAEEVYFNSENYAALVKPSDGGTIAALDFRPRNVALINSLERRREASHAKLTEAAASDSSRVDSIHDRVVAKEENLAARLRYDRWPRHAFRLLLFNASKKLADYEQVRLEECAAFAAGRWHVDSAASERLEMSLTAPLSAAATGSAAEATLRAEKLFAFARAGDTFSIACDVRLASQGPASRPVPDTPPNGKPLHLFAGIEVVLNFLAPNANDRYFDLPAGRQPLNWCGSAPASSLRVVDEWQDVAARIEAPAAAEFWIAPVETISISEEGFERVYQGSQILAVWPIELSAGANWDARLALHIGPARA